MTRLSRQLKIINQLGLHARPAAMLVKAASGFKSQIFVARNGYEVNGKSIMGIMMLAAEQGALLDVSAQGEDAVEALAAIEQLVRSGFGED